MRTVGFSILFTIICTMSAIAQSEKVTTSPSRDFFMLQIHYDNWAQKPDSIKFGANRGFNIYFMYDFPIGTSNFSFAPGLGVGTYNYYLKNRRAVMEAGNEQIEFQATDTNVYSKSKLALSYIEAPFELRYFANKLDRNKGFKAGIGLKVGYMINAHSKDRLKVNGLTITQKTLTKQYMNQWNFSPTLRLGWGNFSIYGQYNISTAFKSNAGPEVFPWSIGIALSGL